MQKLLEIYPDAEIISVTSNNNTIVIRYPYQTIYISAYGECRSVSGFRLPIGYENFNEIVGKRLISVEEISGEDLTVDYKDEEESEYQYYKEYVNMHYFLMDFADDTTFNFAIANKSNGYYDGWIEMMQDYEDNILDDVCVTIIIGLPGSGKTHMSQKLAKKHNAKILDDILSNHEQFKKTIKLHKKFIVNDPRFCDSNTFERFITMAKSLILQKNINLILFENNPDHCMNNIVKREKDPDTVVNLIKFINKYSAGYDPSNKIYSNNSSAIVPVLKQK